MAATIDTSKLTPGKTVSFEVVKAPRTTDQEQTICRLMRQDPSIKKALKQGQEDRMTNLYVRSRGKRPWEVRRKSAKIARAEVGEKWSMPWVPHLAADLNNVAEFVRVSK